MEATLEEARDVLFSILALNYKDLNYYMFHVVLFLFCLNIAVNRKNENALAQLAYTYGGSTLAGALIGVTPFIFTNKLAIPTHILARAAVYFLPPDVFRTPLVQWTLKTGSEVCRCMIATTWYSHAQRALGKQHGFEAILIGTMAGSFGGALGSLSVKQLFTPTTLSLLPAMVAYQTHFTRASQQEENLARSAIVMWMLSTQHLLPKGLDMFNKNTGNIAGKITKQVKVVKKRRAKAE